MIVTTQRKSPPIGERMEAYAEVYAERFGLSVVPVAGKLPCVKWKPFQERRPTLEEIRGWQWEGVGIITGAVSGLAVVDCDAMEEAREFFRKGGRTPTMVRTKRGIHFYFRHPGFHVITRAKVRTDAGVYDLRGDGGLVIAPPSAHREWIIDEAKGCLGLQHIEKLPLFQADWLPPAERRVRERSPKDISSPEAYIAKITAVAGNGGHDQTYKAVSYLRDSGVPKSEAALILARWNMTNADPPWGDGELAHKLDDVFGG